MNKLLGKTVVDILTGFKGIATGYVEYISGCNQVLIQPRLGEDGKMIESHWIDEQRVEVQEDKKTIKLENGENPGFGKQAPKR